MDIACEMLLYSTRTQWVQESMVGDPVLQKKTWYLVSQVDSHVVLLCPDCVNSRNFLGLGFLAYNGKAKTLLTCCMD